MKPPFITICAFCLFVLVFIFPTTYDSEMISRETQLQNYRDKFHIEHGTSTDGILSMTKSKENFNISPRQMVSNHNRTIRAYLSQNNSTEETTLIVEQVRPRSTYVLRGPFHVSKNSADIHWIAPTLLRFVGKTPEGEFIEYILNVNKLSYTSQVYSEQSIDEVSLTDDFLVD